MIQIRTYDEGSDFEAVLGLYAAVNWLTYTADPDRLRRALHNSHTTLVAIRDSEVVGLLRALSDGEVICYIQDILVAPQHQRSGIGKALVSELLDLVRVRQTVLMTDSEEKQVKFYESLGFSLISGQLNGFVKIS